MEGGNMAIVGGDELLEAQAHIWKHIFSFINSMSLKCAVQLGIPDAIHSHGPHPMPLSRLVSALQLPPRKTASIYRLMRLLTHSGFFQVIENNDKEEEEGYMLTNSSRLLLKDNPLSVAPLLTSMLNPAFLEPWQFLSTWFRNDDQTSFYTTHGMPVWEYMGNHSKDNDVFNAAMASDSRLAMSVLLGKYRSVFDGLNSIVDVGGGNGTVAEIIAEAFPETECTVFDLPQVVADLKGDQNLKYVAGDMFEAIPPADAILLKNILHNWSDEECLKIVKKCKLAITNNNYKKGKVIVIDIVDGNISNKLDDSIKVQLFMDMLMMAVTTGKERAEKEWAELITQAGFSSYNISPILHLYNLLKFTLEYFYK